MVLTITWYVMAAKVYQHLLTNLYFYSRTQYIANLRLLFNEICAFVRNFQN